MNDAKFFRDFWKNQTTPLHRHNDEATYKAYAHELKNIFDYLLPIQNPLTLEIGCGNGALFPFFDFSHEKYEGIDISPSLLKEFRDKYPHLRLSEQGGEDYTPSKTYDLIFGNAVHQHFSPRMLEAHLNKLLPHLNANGLFLIANLPYRPNRLKYLLDEFNYPGKKVKSFSFRTKVVLRSVLDALLRKRDLNGFWYKPSEISRMIGPRFTIQAIGSNFYPYRVHLAIQWKEHPRS